MQMQGAMREGQMSQMKIDEMLAERKEIDGLAAKLKEKGYTPKAYFTELVSSRNPARMQQGAEGLRRLELQDEFNTLFKGSLGAMFGAAPAPGAATPTTAESAPTPGSFSADVAARTAAVPEWARPASTPAPMNAMLGNAPSVNNLARQGASVEDMERMVLGLGKYSKDVPGAETVSKLLEEKIKAARAITTVAPGTTALRDGVPMYTAPTSFETMLANSELTTEAKVLARKALINKETNIAQPEFIDNLRALAEAKDPATIKFLTNRLIYMTTHAPGTNLSVNTVVPASVEAQKEFMKETRATYGALKQSSAMFANIEAAKKLIPSASAFMGAGGEGMKTAASFLNNRLGMNINTEGVKDATELQSRLFQGIMDNLRKLDAQPSERQQAALQEALGSLATDPKALSNVLDAFADSVRNKIDIHNAEVQSAISRGVKFPYDPIIKVPAKATAGNVTTNPQYPGFSIGKP